MMNPNISYQGFNTMQAILFDQFYEETLPPELRAECYLALRRIFHTRVDHLDRAVTFVKGRLAEQQLTGQQVIQLFDDFLHTARQNEH